MGLFNRKNKDNKQSNIDTKVNFFNDDFIALKNKISQADYETDFVYNYLNKSTQIIPKNLSFQLKSIMHYQSITEHIENLKNRGWQDSNIEYILNGLNILKNKGLIQNKSDFLNFFKKNNSHNYSVPKISVIGWISVNRIKELKYSMESFILNQKKFDRSVKYIVFDDTDDKNTVKNKQEMLYDISKQNQVDVYYAGKKEKYEFIKELYKSGKNDGVSESILNFAFFDPFQCNITIGANRNSLLIGTIGEIVMSNDDDEICKLISPIQNSKSVHFSSKFDPRNINIFFDRKTLLNSNDFIDKNILNLHEKMLGKNIPDYINENLKDFDININSVSVDYNHLLQSKETNIIATMSGICGNSGMESQKIILGLEGEIRDFIIMSKSNYTDAAKSREMIRMVNQDTICLSPLLMAGNIGLDNRKLLPPFFPVMRNQDGVFASVLRKVNTGALIGHVPIAVYHDNPGTEQLNAENIIKFSPRISEIINLITNSFHKYTYYDSIDKNLELLGNYFIETGSLNINDFNEFLKVEYISQISSYIHYFENLLIRYNNQPVYWADDVTAHIENIQECIKESSFLIPSDLKTNRTSEEANLLCKKLVLEYGSLLKAWPLINEKAVELKKNGKFIFNKL